MRQEKFLFPFVGDFRELEYGTPDALSLRDAVRAHEASHERDLVRYLRSGVAVFMTPTAAPDVLSPHAAVIGGLHLLTDGQWTWFSDLAQYVEHYHVALDPRFLAHVQGNGWTVPDVGDDRLEAMEAALLGDAPEQFA